MGKNKLIIIIKFFKLFIFIIVLRKNNSNHDDILRDFSSILSGIFFLLISFFKVGFY